MPRTNKLATDVFTPRGALPNPDMYIPRPDLEADLKQALTINTNVLIRGDSGCGKSWLYKKVLADLEIGSCAAKSGPVGHFNLGPLSVRASGREIPSRLKRPVALPSAPLVVPQARTS